VIVTVIKDVFILLLAQELLLMLSSS